jgi:hypothetical protein
VGRQRSAKPPFSGSNPEAAFFKVDSSWFTVHSKKSSRLKGENLFACYDTLTEIKDETKEGSNS